MKWVFLVLCVFLLAGCTSVVGREKVTMTDYGVKVTTGGNPMKLTSQSFDHNSKIPAKYTCDGDDVNPPLTVAKLPAETRTLVLIVDDPDAPVGTWDHWIVYNIARTESITENSVPGVQGQNSWKRNDWGGPCPPSGEHRYIFKLYALDIDLPLEEGATKAEVEAAMDGHVLEKAELTGLYSKA